MKQLQLYSDGNKFNINSVFLMTNSLKTDEFDMEISVIIDDILNNNLKVEPLQVLENQQDMQGILHILSTIPLLEEIKIHKVTIPEFEEIEVMKTDSAEIKKFIRKANYDFLGFHCNHKIIDKNYEKINSLIANIYTSKEFIEYRKLYKYFAYDIYELINYDIVGKKARYKMERNYTGDAKYRAEKLIELIIKINSKIISANSTLIKECSKCKAAVKKYNYVIKEVQRMREEYNNQNLPAENTYSILQFLNEEFPTIDRFPMSDVINRYKQKFGMKLTIEEMKNKIEETNKFTVTCCKRKYFVNRK